MTQTSDPEIQNKQSRGDKDMNNNGQGREHRTARTIASIAILTAILLLIFATTALPSNADEIIESKFTPKSDRDPFTPLKVSKDQTAHKSIEVPTNQNKKTVDKPGKEPKKKTLVTKKPKGEHPIELPHVSITGIIKTKSGNRAILNIRGKSKIVGVGQKLDEWKVSSIGNRTVILTSGKKTAKIVLPSDTALTEKKK